MAGLTRQLLSFSRREVFAPQELDLNVVVLRIEKMLRRLIGEDVTVQSRLASPLGGVRADPGQIEQILFNLASNGREGATKIQQIRPAVKVLYMTGYTDDIILRQGVLHEGPALLHKPFTLASLARKVRQALDAR